MNVKPLIILCAGIVLGIGTVAYYLLSPDTPPTPSGRTVTLPTSSQAPVSPSTTRGATGIILAGQGTSIDTKKNFLSDPSVSEDPINKGYYRLGTGAPFSIIFIKSTSFFIISLDQEPLGETRRLAETYLQGLLSISTDQMCALNYTIAAPTAVSEVYGGANVGFSFCPGAAVLP